MNSKKLSPEQSSGVYIASGSVYPRLADEIAESIGTEARGIERKQFANTEVYVRPLESVRGTHFLAIQALAAANGLTVNDALMELMIMVDAAKRASASEITAVVPYLAYSRQERKARGRDPISAAVVTGMLQNVGVDRIVSVDLHAAAIQGNFHGPFDHLTAYPLISSELKSIVGENYDAFVIVSPDEGRTKESGEFANDLGLDVVHMPKSRDRSNPGTISRPKRIDGVDGRTAIMVDDMLDTSRTLISAAHTLKDSGVKSVIVAATHGLFSDPALEILQDAPIDKMLVTDTVPQDRSKEALGDRLQVISSAPMIGRALLEIITHGSVSGIFRNRNYR